MYPKQVRAAIGSEMNLLSEIEPSSQRVGQVTDCGLVLVVRENLELLARSDLVPA